MVKKYEYFMGTSKFDGKYGSMCGQIWVPYHDSLSEDAVKRFEQPIKNKNPNMQPKKVSWA